MSELDNYGKIKNRTNLQKHMKILTNLHEIYSEWWTWFGVCPIKISSKSNLAILLRSLLFWLPEMIFIPKPKKEKKLSLVKLSLPLDFWEVSHDFFTVVSPCYLLIQGKILSYWDTVKCGRYWSIVSLLKMKNFQHPVKIFFWFGRLKMLQYSRKFYQRLSTHIRVTN